MGMERRTSIGVQGKRRGAGRRAGAVSQNYARMAAEFRNLNLLFLFVAVQIYTPKPKFLLYTVEYTPIFQRLFWAGGGGTATASRFLRPSYTTKNTAHDGPISATRGPSPANKSRPRLPNPDPAPVVIFLVLNTSSGVVRAAAIVPAMAPSTAVSTPDRAGAPAPSLFFGTVPAAAEAAAASTFRLLLVARRNWSRFLPRVVVFLVAVVVAAVQVAVALVVVHFWCSDLRIS